MPMSYCHSVLQAESWLWEGDTGGKGHVICTNTTEAISCGSTTKACPVPTIFSLCTVQLEFLADPKVVSRKEW